MKPRKFDLVRAESTAEALAALSESGGNAKIFAGGQSLMAMMNLRLADPDVMVDISQVTELSYLKEVGDKLEIGAAATQVELLSWPGLAEKLPLLHQAIPHLGHFQTQPPLDIDAVTRHAIQAPGIGGLFHLRQNRLDGMYH